MASICLLAAIAGCGRGGGGGAPAAGSPAPGPSWRGLASAARLYYDNSGGIRDSLRVVIRDPATLNAVWSQATSGQTTPPPAPAVDFGREMLLLVSAGRKTPEEQIRVDSVVVQRLQGGPQTFYALVRLTEGCQRFNIDAFPLEIVRVDRFEGPVEFVERVDRPTDCLPGN
jgi:hypothetical protein